MVYGTGARGAVGKVNQVSDGSGTATCQFKKRALGRDIDLSGLHVVFLRCLSFYYL